MHDYATPALNDQTRYMTAFFATRRDVQPDQFELTWDELAHALLEHVARASKHDAPLWSPTRYREGATRGREGVQEVTLLVADIDDGTSPEELEGWLRTSQCAYLMASTWSHTAEVPRLRVVVPLARPVPVAEYDEIWRRFNQHVMHAHIDPSTRDASRMYYLPSCAPERLEAAYARRVDGASFDASLLPPVVEPIRAQIRPDMSGPRSSDEEYRARCFLGKWQRELAAMAPDTGRHNALRSKAVAAGGLVAMGLLDAGEACEVLLSACEQNGLLRDPGGAAMRTIEDGLKYGALTPWRPDSLPDSPAWRARLDSSPRLGKELNKAVSVSPPLRDRNRNRSPEGSLALAARSAADIGALALPEIEWIARPWIAAGCLTELDGRAKAAGKTTWMLDAVRSVLRGERFLSEPTLRSPVLLLSEQTERSLQQALRRARLLDARDLHVVLRHQLGDLRWQDMVGEATDYCRTLGARFLVIDTLAPWLGLRGDAENNAAEAMLAIQPLQEACARDDLGILINRHERKSGGEVGESGRGSSAYAGAVDVILALRRGGRETRPTVRVLEALSRYDETPSRTVIELQDGHYVVLEDNGELAFSEVQYQIISALKERGRMRVLQFREFVSVGRTQLDIALRSLLERGLIRRDVLKGTGAQEFYLPPEEEEPGELDL